MTDASGPDDPGAQPADHGDPADRGDPADTAASRRGRLPTVLVVVATVLAVLSTVTSWVRLQALDTESWVEVADELLADETVRDAVATRIVDTIYEQVDVAADLEDRLGDPLGTSAGLLAAALREPAGDAVAGLLASDQVRSRWLRVNERAHSTLVAIVREDDLGAVSTVDGEVALELRPLVISVGERLGLSADLLERIPDDAGRVVVFESDELESVQQVVRVLDLLSWFMFVVVVGLYVAAVVVAPAERRRGVVRSIGWSLVVGGLVALLLRRIAVRSVVGVLVVDVSNEPLATVVSEIATGLLERLAWNGVVFGVLIVAVAGLLGDTVVARSVRSGLAPAFGRGAVAAFACGALVLLAVLWWSPGRSMEHWASALVLTAVTVAAVVALRRRVLAESPGRSWSDVGASISGALGRGERVDPDRAT